MPTAFASLSHHLHTALLVPAAHFCARVLHFAPITQSRGAERRETFGCSGTRGAYHHASKTA
jgi:hypothetical protein